MYKFFCITFCVLCTYCISAQLENSNWVFPDSVGLNFNSEVPTYFNTNMKGYEASASISDSLGNLLFYTNGEIVWNKINGIMNNGNDLSIGLVGDAGSSITQGVVIIPKPGSKSLYYIFQLQKNYSPDIDGLQYSIVDISLDGGLGDVIEKNISLYDKPLTEKMQAVKHGNGRDWWLLLNAWPDFGSSADSSFSFIRFLITSNGMEGPFVQKIGPNDSELIPYSGWGEMAFSDQGDKLAYTRYNRLDIYDFDRCSGLLSNWVEITGFPDISLYGCSFSSSGNNIYVAQISSKGSLYQVSITNEDPIGFIVNEIFKVPVNNYVIGQLQIYDDLIFFPIIYKLVGSDVTSIFNQSISCIKNANDLFESVFVDTNSIYLMGKKTIGALPNLPNYSLGILEGSECDTLNTAIIEEPKPEIEYSIYPNPAINYLQVETSQAGNHTIIIRDIKGSVYYTGNFNNQIQIPVAPYAKGVYSITIINDETEVVWSDKFVKI